MSHPAARLSHYLRMRRYVSRAAQTSPTRNYQDIGGEDLTFDLTSSDDDRDHASPSASLEYGEASVSHFSFEAGDAANGTVASEPLRALTPTHFSFEVNWTYIESLSTSSSVPNPRLSPPQASTSWPLRWQQNFLIHQQDLLPSPPSSSPSRSSRSSFATAHNHSDPELGEYSSSPSISPNISAQSSRAPSPVHPPAPPRTPTPTPTYWDATHEPEEHHHPFLRLIPGQHFRPVRPNGHATPWMPRDGEYEDFVPAPKPNDNINLRGRGRFPWYVLWKGVAPGIYPSCAVTFTAAPSCFIAALWTGFSFFSTPTQAIPSESDPNKEPIPFSSDSESDSEAIAQDEALGVITHSQAYYFRDHIRRVQADYRFIKGNGRRKMSKALKQQQQEARRHEVRPRSSRKEDASVVQSNAPTLSKGRSTDTSRSAVYAAITRALPFKTNLKFGALLRKAIRRGDRNVAEAESRGLDPDDIESDTSLSLLTFSPASSSESLVSQATDSVYDISGEEGDGL
ncbi:hypothetical protein OF83DRAFT_1177350 [Amylostereum chailletii]|nr:hypothetical protein OF83DRAFT_1177350 [Amylostereum chailletii]